MNSLIITVMEIKGTCPVYHLGDRIFLDEGYRLNLQETDGKAKPYQIRQFLRIVEKHNLIMEQKP